MDSAVRKFIFHDLRTVEGYIDPPDALVFLSLLQNQQANDLTGGIAEIGVFYGRSYFLVRKIAGTDEKVLAIDLFEQPTNGHASQYSRFIENARRLDLPVDEDLIIKGDSTRLKPSDVTDRIGKVRFFSVDGGHMLSDVLADGRLAMDCLADHGVIAFDDTFNPAWPEVTIGLTDILRQESEAFSAFCMTRFRTYVCRREFHAFYRNAIAEAHDLEAFDHTETELLGSSITRLHDPVRRRIVYELMARLRMGRLLERAYR